MVDNGDPVLDDGTCDRETSVADLPLVPGGDPPSAFDSPAPLLTRRLPGRRSGISCPTFAVKPGAPTLTSAGAASARRRAIRKGRSVGTGLVKAARQCAGAGADDEARALPLVSQPVGSVRRIAQRLLTPRRSAPADGVGREGQLQPLGEIAWRGLVDAGRQGRHQPLESGAELFALLDAALGGERVFGSPSG